MCILQCWVRLHVGWLGIGSAVLSSSKIGTSSWRYYSNSVARGACEYYAGRGESPGRRRNARWLQAGQGNVRNGDRYHVLSAGDAGLLVEQLGGSGRALLFTAYVTTHCEYGWASTIDGAQGATADIGILLARPGLDREHLYVGLTRGRLANHVPSPQRPTTTITAGNRGFPSSTWQRPAGCCRRRWNTAAGRTPRTPSATMPAER